MFDVTVIIITYNRLDALKLVLEGYKRQSHSNFEVIVADDGSTDETRDYLSANKDSFGFPLRHIWHEDKGFRKSRIMNIAIAAAKADYLIFNDGDCIPHEHFVRSHLELSESGHFIVGRYVFMGENISKRVDEAFIRAGRLDKSGLRFLIDSAVGKTRFPEFAFYVRCRVLMKLLNGYRIRQHWDEEVGGYNRCIYDGNFSIWKSALIQVNGFDEEFEGWGGWDFELHYRLLHIGLKPKPSMNRVVTYHYHHDRSHTVMPETNRQRYARTKSSSEVKWCDTGLDQHLDSRENA